MICKHILLITFLNEPELLWHTVTWFQLLLHNSHNLLVICLHTVCSIWPIDRTISGATTPDQSGLGSNGKDWILYIPQSSKSGALPLDGLMSYPGHSGGGLTPLQRCSQCNLYLRLTGLTNNLPIAVLHQVLLSNTNKVYTMICIPIK